jgi:3-hydroxybutyryl-CoA dehydrogenase
MKIEEVLVLGAGAMGREIALQCAMFGYRTTVYDTNREALANARAIVDLIVPTLAGTYVQDTAAAIKSRIYYTLDLEEAAAGADLISENVPEDPQIKGRALARVHPLAPPHAIFATNSSSLTPSQFAEMTGRPERLLAMHFHKTVWVSNVVDIMPHAGTAPGLADILAGFARSIRQIPIVLREESQGYTFNSLLHAYQSQALSLWTRGLVSFENIDRAWMVAERASHGPFGAMDFMGLDTVYAVTNYWAVAENHALALAAAKKLKTEFVDRGRLGVKSGAGFYSYPDPAFSDPRFLDPSSLGADAPAAS